MLTVAPLISTDQAGAELGPGWEVRSHSGGQHRIGRRHVM